MHTLHPASNLCNTFFHRFDISIYIVRRESTAYLMVISVRVHSLSVCMYDIKNRTRIISKEYGAQT